MGRKNWGKPWKMNIREAGMSMSRVLILQDLVLPFVDAAQWALSPKQRDCLKKEENKKNVNLVIITTLH